MSKIQKTVLTVIMILISIPEIYSQVTITSAQMPDPGDQMVFGIRPEPGGAVSGYTTSGTGIMWNFSTITAASTDTNRFISSTSGEIPFICIAIFNNPLDSMYNATAAKVGLPLQIPMGLIPITDLYDFFRKTNYSYSQVGRSASVNGIPSCIKNNPPDRVYKFPFSFGDTLNSVSNFEIVLPGVGYYRQTKIRNSQADAWGTVVTPSGTFNALRIKSILEITDTVYSENFGVGVKIPHTETHYTWLSNTLKFPVFVIEEKGPNFGGTVALWADTVSNTNITTVDYSENVLVFPNPAGEFVNIYFSGSNCEDQEFSLYDIHGKECIRETIHCGRSQISLQGIPAGVYVLKAKGSTRGIKVLVF